MSSSTQSDNTMMNEPSSTLLVLGSCGLDRLLTVPRYPAPEMKVLTTEYHVVGGGNASNVAHAAALLLQDHRRIQLCTKVGSDGMGQAVTEELECAGIDIHHDLFQVVPDTTTALTTVIVSASEHTRTCMHTPGTCGEWSLHEVQRLDHHVSSQQPNTRRIDWENVCHFHSDARHTEAACFLARKAKQRNIPVSLDVEKDRGSMSLDELLELADIIFTNALQIEEYLERLTREWEASTQRKPLDNPDLRNQSNVSQSFAQIFLHALGPSMYFARRYRQVGKEVVITKGDQGSIHVCCESVNIVDEDSASRDSEHTVILKEDEHAVQSEGIVYNLRQVFVDDMASSCHRVEAVYSLRAVGVLPHVTIADTTGAGDAFLGGYLAAQLDPEMYPTVTDRMRLAAWVAGHKLQGPGARSTLPSAAQREAELGRQNHAASLRSAITVYGSAVL
eukprot:scaffold362_cov176-Amphora_coffeaeformis.AAC.42